MEPVPIDADLVDADWPKASSFDMRPEWVIAQLEAAPVDDVRRWAMLPSMRNAPAEVWDVIRRRLDIG